MASPTLKLFLTKMLRRLLKVGVISLACFLLIFVLAWGLISLPVIQQKVLNALTGFVEKKTQTRVFIEKVDIDFFSSLNLSHVYLEDQEQDTLVYAGKIGLDMNMLNLFRKRIFLDEIELVFNTVEDNRQTYNFQIKNNRLVLTSVNNEKELIIEFVRTDRFPGVK